MEDRYCTTCNSKLVGRKDKVFCNDQCKNEHHKEARMQTSCVQHLKNKKIKRNYTVLEGIFCANRKKIKLNLNQLIKYGFDIFELIKDTPYHTNLKISFYEYEIIILKNQCIEISRVNSVGKVNEIFKRRWEREFPLTIGKILDFTFREIWYYFEEISCFSVPYLTVKSFKQRE